MDNKRIGCVWCWGEIVGDCVDSSCGGEVEMDDCRLVARYENVYAVPTDNNDDNNSNNNKNSKNSSSSNNSTSESDDSDCIDHYLHHSHDVVVVAAPPAGIDSIGMSVAFQHSNGNWYNGTIIDINDNNNDDNCVHIQPDNGYFPFHIR